MVLEVPLAHDEVQLAVVVGALVGEALLQAVLVPFLLHHVERSLLPDVKVGLRLFVLIFWQACNGNPWQLEGVVALIHGHVGSLLIPLRRRHKLFLLHDGLLCVIIQIWLRAVVSLIQSVELLPPLVLDYGLHHLCCRIQTTRRYIS